MQKVELGSTENLSQRHRRADSSNTRDQLKKITLSAEPGSQLQGQAYVLITVSSGSRKLLMVEKHFPSSFGLRKLSLIKKKTEKNGKFLSLLLLYY